MTTDCYYFQLVEVLSSSLKLKQKYINVSDRFDLHMHLQLQPNGVCTLDFHFK